VTKFLSEVISAERPKPHSSAITMVLDRLGYSVEETLALLSDYIDVVKIGWGLPFLLEANNLKHRVERYLQSGLFVSNGGTLLESAITKGKEETALTRLVSSGFNTIELSEGLIEVPFFKKKKIAEFVHGNNLRLHVEVGRKNPKNQLSLEETFQRVQESLDLEPDMMIIEGRESGRGVGIYEEDGSIKWNWVDRLVEIDEPMRLMFEAPQETQQAELIIHLSREVNLGNVGLPSIGALETQRQGLRGDTFGMTRGSTQIVGGPAVKFVYFLISSYGSIDQTKIMKLSGLNRRTVQESVQKLMKQGMIQEDSDYKDLRKRVYTSNR
jgi:phosphosulfolactate synthase